MIKSRREFLTGMGCTLLSRAAIFAGAERLLMVNALAKPSAADPGYKALVCLFLFGGNDANNLVIPYDNYADYDAVRGGTGIQIPQGNLLQISVPSAGATFGLHPGLGNQFNGSSLFDLWGQGKVAIAANVGTLIRPVSRPDYRAGLAHPYQLFSHSDQQNEWQTSYATSPFPTGWGGRTADVFGIDPSGFPTIASVAGVTIFSSGRSTRPIVLPDAGTSLANSLKLKRASDAQDGSPLRQLLTQDATDDGTPTLVKDTALITAQAIQNSLALQSGGDVVTSFPNTGLGRQLKQIARLIKLAPTIGIARQVFFCSIGGFDTHNNQGSLNLGTGQPSLLNQVSQAVAAFYSCVSAELGIGPQVTTFTMSDFSRTFKTGGTGGATGTDHAWGSHHFVIGDSVLGGDFYGTYPTLALSGSDDTDDGPGARGRWIPTTGVDQYAATLAHWFGLSSTDILTVFPNIGNFGTSDLGFMAGQTIGPNRTRRVRRA